MINRTLIRIKVVQMLYSYLLTRSEFKIDSAPEVGSRDRKYGYSVYVDLLMLILELSGIRLPRPDGSLSPEITVDKKLEANRVGRALYGNDSIKAIIGRGSSGVKAFDSCLQKLAHEIAESKVFTEYRRKQRKSLADDVDLWITLVSTVIRKSADVEAALRTNPEFTALGFEQGVDRLINTLSSYNDSREAFKNAHSELIKSLDKAYELYAGMFQLMIELTRQQEEIIENNRTKHLATAEEKNPDMRFVENRFIRSLTECTSLQEYIEKNHVTWETSIVMTRKLLDSILASDYYREYMALPTTDYAIDCELWRNLMRTVILPSDELAEELEERSVYWNDDLHIMGTFVLKTIKHFATVGEDSASECRQLLPKYKDEEDARFGEELFDYAVENRETYRAYIDRFIDSRQWDSERIAFMDIVIMITAIAELVNYPAIPVAVTLNEFIEIANNYSTEKSGQFVNGILYSVICALSEEGKLGKPIDERR